MAPVHQYTSVGAKTVTPLSGKKTLLLCNKPSTIKIIPGVLKDNATSSLRILPQKVPKEPKMVIDPRITSSASSAKSSSEGHPANQGLQLTSQSWLTLKNQDPQQLDNPVHTNTPPTREFYQDSQCSTMSPKNVIFTDHSYTFEMKMSTESEKPVDVSNDGSDPANGSTEHMLLKEVLDLGLVKEAEGADTRGAVLGTESGVESKAGLHPVEEDDDSDCTELTEDSDMYNDTDSGESSDEEELCVPV